MVIPEDWFALSHFENVLSKLSACVDLVVATRSSGRLGELEALGVRTHNIDMHRGSLNPVVLAGVRNELARLIDDERPHIVHAVSLQTMAMTSLALERAAHRPSAVLLHLTGLGYLGSSRSWLARLMLPAVLVAVKRAVRDYDAWLLAENLDDVAFMVQQGAAVSERTVLIPGAGIDPDFYSAQLVPQNSVPRAAFVGRMLWSKGVEVLVEAQRRLRRRGTNIDLDLYGAADLDSRQAISRKTLTEWSKQPGVNWHGRVSDIVGVWRRADIAVFPSYGGEGVPRAMLEAASCARPLIVSDVPGCRNFVQEGVEGLVVPPGDHEALSASLAYLASNATLRRQMGIAAREKVLAKYTAGAVAASVFSAYQRVLKGWTLAWQPHSNSGIRCGQNFCPSASKSYLAKLKRYEPVPGMPRGTMSGTRASRVRRL